MSAATVIITILLSGLSILLTFCYIMLIKVSRDKRQPTFTSSSSERDEFMMKGITSCEKCAAYIDGSCSYNPRRKMKDYSGHFFVGCPLPDVKKIEYGFWIYDDYGYARCSECGYEVKNMEVSSYCPQCGADMSSGEEGI